MIQRILRLTAVMAVLMVLSQEIVSGRITNVAPWGEGAAVTAPLPEIGGGHVA
jgi:hypothetical protein